jgi:hypothetical protein
MELRAWNSAMLERRLGDAQFSLSEISSDFPEYTNEFARRLS